MCYVINHCLHQIVKMRELQVSNSIDSSNYNNVIVTVECSVALQPETFQVVKVTHVQKSNNEFMVR